MWADALDDSGVEAAIAEARRRWGPTGAISLADQFPRSRLLVGELRGGRFWIHGRGSSWKAAFVDADARVIRASRGRAALCPAVGTERFRSRHRTVTGTVYGGGPWRGSSSSRMN